MSVRLVGAHAGYGAIRVLRGVDLEVPPGGFEALIGSNGAGKSTLVRTIAGVVALSAGSVWLGDRDVTHWAPHRRIRAGIGYVPEGRMVLAPLPVIDNLTLSTFRRRLPRHELSARLEHVFTLFPRLGDRRRQTAGSLSGGEQQMLALGRALMTAPTTLVLDEPTMGLAPALVDVLGDALRTVSRAGVGVLLVEQNAPFAFELANHVHVLDRGLITASGPPQRLRDHPQVAMAYLGERP
jgi:branched-chain amino acid transport system ATP-binding protein